MDSSDTDKPQKDSKEQGWPLTTEDLYAPSGKDEQPLVYEETPIIEPEPDESQEEPAGPAVAVPEVTPDTGPGETIQAFTVPVQQPPKSPVSVPGRVSLVRILVNIFFVVILFSLGVAASIMLRSLSSDFEMPRFRLPSLSKPASPPASPPPAPPAPTVVAEPSVSPVPLPPGSTGAGEMYSVLGGVSKKPSGVSFRLPEGVRVPTCDSGACASQGMDLPGGTRFTVALRGTGQLLPDPRGKILTDASGREFTFRDTNAGGFAATEFTADFTGSTGGGYAFTKMRGLMVYVSDALSVEISHFSPAGRQTDFAKDDSLVNDILTTLTYR